MWLGSTWVSKIAQGIMGAFDFGHLQMKEDFFTLQNFNDC